jgi:beta-barrel assembly-enhancing protease
VNIDYLTGQVVQQMQQNNGLKPLGNPEPITVGAMEGRSMMLESSSPFPDANGQPQVERDWLVTMPQRDGSVIFMVFVAPQSDFAHLQPTYEAMLKSVQPR